MDSGFPVGGTNFEGAYQLPTRLCLVKLCVNAKESGPLGEGTTNVMFQEGRVGTGVCYCCL